MKGPADAGQAGLLPIPEDIALLTAPQLFGTLFNWALLGVLTMQVYIYYLNFSQDKIGLKALVYSTYFLEALQSILATVDMYHWFVLGYGNLNILDKTFLSPFDTPAICALVASIVQIFYAFRIYAIRRSLRFVAGFICIVSLFQTATAIHIAVRAFQVGHFSRLPHPKSEHPILFIGWPTSGAIADVTIAAAMCYIFMTTRSQVHGATARALAQIVRMVVETNSLTAAVSISSTIVFLLLPNKPYFICLGLVISKLYSNTLLVTLNNRLQIKNRIQKTELSDAIPSDEPFRSAKSNRFVVSALEFRQAGLSLDDEERSSWVEAV